MQNENPLVSIIVITYNSSKFVLETLESAKAQTYQNIELIVSDDCSTDDTIGICRKWIDENGERFIRTELITTPGNTGIPANCNRGVKVSRGEWVKLIAGDDLLMEECITLFVTEINNSLNRNINFLFGACQKLIGKDIDLKIEIPSFSFRNNEAKYQFYYLVREGNCIHGPTSFLNRIKLIEIGAFDERIKYSEDWPFWIKATDKGNKLHFISNVVAYYRIHENGIYSKTMLKHKYDSRLSQSVNLIRELYLLPILLREKLYFDYWHILLILLKERNTKNKLKHFLYYLMQITDIKAIKNVLIRINNKLN